MQKVFDPWHVRFCHTENDCKVDLWQEEWGSEFVSVLSFSCARSVPTRTKVTAARASRLRDTGTRTLLAWSLLFHSVLCVDRLLWWRRWPGERCASSIWCSSSISYSGWVSEWTSVCLRIDVCRGWLALGTLFNDSLFSPQMHMHSVPFGCLVSLDCN